jgi:hypothetical protein
LKVRKTFKINYFLCIYALGVFLLLPKLGILARYPWPDLIYADFQIYNRWRWFAESITTSGFGTFLLQSIDFRINTGENVFLASRVSSPLFDIGAWVYLLSNSLDIALAFKFIIYSYFTYKGITLLMGKILQSKEIYNPRNLLLFSVALLSIIGHPILFHEVGPMSLWYLMLTPYWLYLFIHAYYTGIKKIFSEIYLFPLIFLTIGGSDLFIFFYFLNFLFILLLIKNISMKKSKDFLAFFIVIEFIMLLSKIPYLFFRLSSSYESWKGSWNLKEYFFNFIKPLLTNSILVPDFTGPMSLFVNFVLAILVFTLIRGKDVMVRKTLFLLGFNLIFLLCIGAIFHSIPILSDNLPSALRYHVAVWPIFVSMIVPLLYVYSHGFLTSKSKNHIYSLLLIPVILSMVNIEYVYSQFTPSPSKRVIERDLRNYAMQDLPNCLNKIIEQSNKNHLNRSFLFTTSTSEKDMSDALNLLIDNPTSLHGRTFNQWRYSYPKSTIVLAQNFDLGIYFTRPFKYNQSSQINGYGSKTQSPFILSTESDLMGFNQLGVCKLEKETSRMYFPFSKKTILDLLRGTSPNAGNYTFVSDIYLYQTKEASPHDNTIPKLEFESSYVTVAMPCEFKGDLLVPINQSNELYNVYTSNFLKYKNNQYSFANLSLSNESCEKNNKQITRITSRSVVVLSDFVLLLSILMLFSLNLSVRIFSKSNLIKKLRMKNQGK